MRKCLTWNGTWSVRPCFRNGIWYCESWPWSHGYIHKHTYPGWLTQRVLSDRSKALFAAGARVEPTTITMAIILHWPTALRRASNPDSAALVAASLSLLYSWLVSPDQKKITNTHTHWGQRKEHSESHPYSCPSFDIFIFIFIRP